MNEIDKISGFIVPCNRFTKLRPNTWVCINVKKGIVKFHKADKNHVFGLHMAYTDNRTMSKVQFWGQA